jgi:hypothetical protein
MRFLFFILTFLFFILFWSFSGIAQHHHGGMSMPAMPGMEGEKKMEPAVGRETSSNRTFLLDGVKASFSIRPMIEHKKMLQDMRMKVEVDPRATHNIAVTLYDTRNNQAIIDGVVKMKVIDPQGKEQTKLLDFMMGMNQYAGDFTLSGKGRYQILILLKAEGKKLAGGFYYRLD